MEKKRREKRKSDDNSRSSDIQENKNLKKQKAETHQLTDARALLEEMKQNHEAEVNSLKFEAQTRKEEYEGELQALQDEIAELKEEREKGLDEMTGLKSSVSSLTGELETCRTTINHLRSQQQIVQSSLCTVLNYNHSQIKQLQLQHKQLQQQQLNKQSYPSLSVQNSSSFSSCSSSSCPSSSCSSSSSSSSSSSPRFLGSPPLCSSSSSSESSLGPDRVLDASSKTLPVVAV